MTLELPRISPHHEISRIVTPLMDARPQLFVGVADLLKISIDFNEVRLQVLDHASDLLIGGPMISVSGRSLLPLVTLSGHVVKDLTTEVHRSSRAGIVGQHKRAAFPGSTNCDRHEQGGSEDGL